jgi:hypothetical protein
MPDERRRVRLPGSPTRWGLVLVLAASGAVGTARTPGGAGAIEPPGRVADPAPSVALREVVDVGESLGFPQSSLTWSVDAGDLSGDGRLNDLVVSYHTHVRAYRNVDGTSLAEVFRPHDIGDPHGCLIGDLDRNGLGDVYCTRGAELGTISKTNGLWLQGPTETFTENVASAFGVGDPLGRGRHAALLDLDRDGFLDLFVGNARNRKDGRPSPNRTYLNEAGEGFREVRVGVTREVGTECAQAVDYDRDGWTDLLICGRKRMFLHRNVKGPDGERRLRHVSRKVGLAELSDVRSAWIANLDGRGRPDIVLVRRRRLQVLLWRRGAYRVASLRRDLSEGVWVAVGDVDGRRGLDLYVVQGCEGDRNLPDRLFLNRGDGRFRRVSIPRALSGCGHMARMVDLDGDGRDEIVVLNGGGVWRLTRGPVQVLTMSPALSPARPGGISGGGG